MSNLKKDALVDDEARWLVQFINNCRQEGILWSVGQMSTGLHCVRFIAGAHTFSSQPCERLDVAIRSALDELVKAARQPVG